MRRAVVAGIGSYLPAKVVTNEELTRTVDTTDEWIVERTGIRQRHVAAAHETCAMMATEAARAALADAGVEAATVDAVLVATATPDQQFPAVAVRTQAALGAHAAFGFDVSAACSGFVYGLSIADAMVRAGQVRRVLVVGSEVYSRILDWEDRATCVLFGDGAGAVLLEAREVDGSDAPGVLSTHLHADGRLGDLLYVDGAVGQRARRGHLRMQGREIFRHAVAHLSGAVQESLTANGLSIESVDWLVPHQANLRIIDGVARKLGLSRDKVVVTVDHHANTSAASIPLALAEGWRDGRIKRGHLVLMEALGGGLTWGSALVRM